MVYIKQMLAFYGKPLYDIKKAKLPGFDLLRKERIFP